MSIVKEGYFKSSDGVHEVYYLEYLPSVKPRGIVQISHGMCEYIQRYENFMQFLADEGFVVCGNDHLGHGKTAAFAFELGWFRDENGWKYAVKDLHTMSSIVKKEYPDLPLVLLGHSMGSFFARAYAVKYPRQCAAYLFLGTSDAFESDVQSITAKTVGRFDRFNGAVGTYCKTAKNVGNKLSGKLSEKISGKERSAARAALALAISQAKKLAEKKGGMYKSDRLNKLAFGKYNARITNVRTGYEWLSRDESVCERFSEDPLCNYEFTVNGYINMASALWYVSDDRWFEHFPKNVPAMFMSGTEDPVGNYGAGVKNVYRTLRSEGCEVSIKLYEGARHELLNELNREEVYEDILDFIISNVKIGKEMR